MGYMAVADDFSRALRRLVITVILLAFTLIACSFWVGYHFGRLKGTSETLAGKVECK